MVVNSIKNVQSPFICFPTKISTNHEQAPTFSWVRWRMLRFFFGVLWVSLLSHTRHNIGLIKLDLCVTIVNLALFAWRRAHSSNSSLSFHLTSSGRKPSRVNFVGMKWEDTGVNIFRSFNMDGSSTNVWFGYNLRRFDISENFDKIWFCLSRNMFRVLYHYYNKTTQKYELTTN